MIKDEKNGTGVWVSIWLAIIAILAGGAGAYATLIDRLGHLEEAVKIIKHQIKLEP